MISPLVLVGAAVGIGALFVAASRSNRSEGIDVRVSPGPGTQTQGLNPELLAAMVAATRSGSPREMRRVAAVLRAAGFPNEAAELERQAREINAERNRPPAGTPITEVDRPPPGAVPVTPPRVPDATTQPVPDVEEVDEVPPGARPSEEDRRIPPGTDRLTADYARMIYASAPRGPVKDLDLSAAFKSATNVTGQAKFYGQGPALALIKKGVVPPTPWDWQRANESADKASYRRQLGEAKRNDPARADLWDEAIGSVR